MGPLVNLQVKTTPEVFKTFDEAFKASECTTKGQFIELIIETFLNPPKGKQIEVSKPEDLQQIENLTNEIGRLKSLIDLKDEENQALKDQILQANGNIQSLQSSVPGENQLLITVDPNIKRILEIELEYGKKRTKKDITIEDMLIIFFWECLRNGRSFRMWSEYEINHPEKVK